jgi:small subunit ribosomal protein S15
MDKEQKQAVVKEFGKSKADVGSTEVQVAILTGRIREVTEHLKMHRKDHSSRRGLIAMVNSRRKLLDYLSRKDREKYVALVSKLNLRH